ncbi:MAG TPA: hypothetical protein DDW49_10865 [Deltaproteobacteria bacterium]|nr:MAG: hypothetical protein A2048_07180 [Deltaproteobacteria bacterium GWA2_45_12]HBF13865.1 hypothetical protein [Deltaproteobacteria bacterium]
MAVTQSNPTSHFNEVAYTCKDEQQGTNAQRRVCESMGDGHVKFICESPMTESYTCNVRDSGRTYKRFRVDGSEGRLARNINDYRKEKAELEKIKNDPVLRAKVIIERERNPGAKTVTIVTDEGGDAFPLIPLVSCADPVKKEDVDVTAIDGDADATVNVGDGDAVTPLVDASDGGDASDAGDAASSDGSQVSTDGPAISDVPDNYIPPTSDADIFSAVDQGLSGPVCGERPQVSVVQPGLAPRTRQLNDNTQVVAINFGFPEQSIVNIDTDGIVEVYSDLVADGICVNRSDQDNYPHCLINQDAYYDGGHSFDFSALPEDVVASYVLVVWSCEADRQAHDLSRASIIYMDVDYA